MTEGSGGSITLPSGQQTIHHPQRQQPPEQAHRCSQASPTAAHLQLLPTGPRNDSPAQRGACSRQGEGTIHQATVPTRSHQQPTPSRPVGSQAAVPAISHSKDQPQLPLPLSAILTRPQIGGISPGGDKSTLGCQPKFQVPATRMANKEILHRSPGNRRYETSGSKEERHQSNTASNSRVEFKNISQGQKAASATNWRKPTLTNKKKKQFAAEPCAKEDETIRERLMDGTRDNSSILGRDKQHESSASDNPPVQLAASAQVQAIHPSGSRNSSSSSGESSMANGDRSISSAESLTMATTEGTKYSDYVGVDVNGVQFKPVTHGDGILRPRSHPPRWIRNPRSNIGIGIETEFLLRARCAKHQATSKIEFADMLEDSHNSSVAVVHPYLREEVVFPDPCPKYQGDEWTLVNDDTVITNSEPWAIEMTSPIFVNYPGSPWRRHVEATWKFLKKQYEVIEHDYYGTHIHISVEGGFTLQELKQIAQCVIHFEPAFDALVPHYRRGEANLFAKSNWVDADQFAKANRSRAASIIMIDGIDNLGTLLNVMNPDLDKNFAWNFHSIFKYWTIEFRKAPVSTTIEEVLGWAELAMSFIQSSIRNGVRGKLVRVPSTVGGLRWFLQQSNVPGMNRHGLLERFWEGRRMDDFVPAGQPLGFYDQAELSKLQKLMEEDEQCIRAHAHRARPPYWR